MHLGVDAVLLIGEHGDYPKTPLGQEMVPRRAFFEQIVGTLLEAGTPIPICESPKRPLTSQHANRACSELLLASQHHSDAGIETTLRRCMCPQTMIST